MQTVGEGCNGRLGGGVEQFVRGVGLCRGLFGLRQELLSRESRTWRDGPRLVLGGVESDGSLGVVVVVAELGSLSVRLERDVDVVSHAVVAGSKDVAGLGAGELGGGDEGCVCCGAVGGEADDAI